MNMIREAKIEDLEAIYKFVEELAEYEKEPEAVTSDISDYINAFEKGDIYALVAEQDERIIGMALYYKAFSTWKGPMMYLEDFVVKKEFRGHGVGQKLFDAFIKDSKAKGAVMVKWQVLDWNQTAINFYKKNKAMIEDEWLNGKIIF